MKDKSLLNRIIFIEHSPEAAEVVILSYDPSKGREEGARETSPAAS